MVHLPMWQSCTSVAPAKGRAFTPTADLDFSDKERFHHKNDSSSKMECFKAEYKFECIYKASHVSTQLCLSPPNPETGSPLQSGCAARLTLGFFINYPIPVQLKSKQ